MKDGERVHILQLCPPTSLPLYCTVLYCTKALRKHTWQVFQRMTETQQSLGEFWQNSMSQVSVDLECIPGISIVGVDRYSFKGEKITVSDAEFGDQHDWCCTLNKEQ